MQKNVKNLSQENDRRKVFFSPRQRCLFPRASSSDDQLTESRREKSAVLRPYPVPDSPLNILTGIKLSSLEIFFQFQEKMEVRIGDQIWTVWRMRQERETTEL